MTIQSFADTIRQIHAICERSNAQRQNWGRWFKVQYGFLALFCVIGYTVIFSYLLDLKSVSLIVVMELMAAMPYFLAVGLMTAKGLMNDARVMAGSSPQFDCVQADLSTECESKLTAFDLPALEYAVSSLDTKSKLINIRIKELKVIALILACALGFALIPSFVHSITLSVSYVILVQAFIFSVLVIVIGGLIGLSEGRAACSRRILQLIHVISHKPIHGIPSK